MPWVGGGLVNASYYLSLCESSACVTRLSLSLSLFDSWRESRVESEMRDILAQALRLSFFSHPSPPGVLHPEGSEGPLSFLRIGRFTIVVREETWS